MHNTLRYLSRMLLLVVLPLSVLAQPPNTTTVPQEDEIAVEPVSASAEGAINTAEDVPEFSSASSNNVNRWYQIEMIIFSNSGTASSAETWPQNSVLTYPDNWVELKTSEDTANSSSPANNAKTSPYLLLGSSQQTLNQAEASLKNNGHRILFHGVWREPLPATAQAPAILLSGGKQYGAHRELEGSVTISVGKYIHLDTNLWLTRFANPNEAASGLNTMTLPLSPAQRSSADNSTIAIEQIFLMREQRHLRSKTVHYIDHPYMGMLVTFTPLD